MGLAPKNTQSKHISLSKILTQMVFLVKSNKDLGNNTEEISDFIAVQSFTLF